jgi:hypothetical protein
MHNNKSLYQIFETEIGLSCRATQEIRQNSIIFESIGSIENKASKHSVQIDANHHLLANDDIIYANHSFNPNCHMKVSINPPKIQLIAIRDIKPYEDLMFNYNTSEWELSCPFQDRETQKYVTGCKYLDAQDIKQLWPYFPEWIKDKIKAEIPHVIPHLTIQNAIESPIRHS